MYLTLFIPELIWPEPADKLTLDSVDTPTLNKLLGRNQVDVLPFVAPETSLARCFGYRNNIPYGALRQAGEMASQVNTVSQTQWVCADPVHLRFHQERIILADAGAFDISEDEAHTLVAGLNQQFGDKGEFHAATARRWYLRLNQPCELNPPPLSQVAGRRMDGEEQNHGPMNRWLNEVQMFLHCHPVNQAREERGSPAINSLWLWGCGQVDAPSHRKSHFDRVCANTPLGRGLAITTQTTVVPLPERLSELCQPILKDRRILVVLDTLESAVTYEQGDEWRERLHDMEYEWFMPLAERLGQEIKEVKIIAPTLYGELHITLQPGNRWKFWRKARTISDLAQQLAQPRSPSMENPS